MKIIIGKGHFRKLVDKLLSNGGVFNHEDINFEHPINLDDDPINKQKRINWYKKKRELLLRLAAPAHQDLDQSDSDAKVIGAHGKRYHLIWNLSVNHSHEFAADGVEAAMNVLLRPPLGRASTLPEFKRIFRRDMEVYVDVETHPLKLR